MVLFITLKLIYNNYIICMKGLIPCLAGNTGERPQTQEEKDKAAALAAPREPTTEAVATRQPVGEQPDTERSKSLSFITYYSVHISSEIYYILINKCVLSIYFPIFPPGVPSLMEVIHQQQAGVSRQQHHILPAIPGVSGATQYVQVNPEMLISAPVDGTVKVMTPGGTFELPVESVRESTSPAEPIPSATEPPVSLDTFVDTQLVEETVETETPQAASNVTVETETPEETPPPPPPTYDSTGLGEHGSLQPPPRIRSRRKTKSSKEVIGK